MVDGYIGEKVWVVEVALNYKIYKGIASMKIIKNTIFKFY